MHLRWLAASLAASLLAFAVPESVKAQAIQADVVATCGSSTYAAGHTNHLTVDPSGKACVNATVSASASINAFAPSGQAALSAGVTTSNVALGSSDPTALVTNNGSVTAYVNFGGSGVTATTSSYPIGSGQSIAFNVGANTYIAGITASGTAALSITTGTGLPALGSSGSGGGGGNVNLNQVGGTSYALGSTTSSASMPVVIASDQAAVAVKQTTASNLNATVVGAGTAGTPSGGVVSVQGVASGTALPVSAASLPLPTGAATSAKQPALGTAGTASADVITVQGIASMTALKVDGSAVTQPVSAASLPLPSGAATSALETTINTTLGSPFQAGGSIGNTVFGAKLQDATGTAFGTSGNPVKIDPTGTTTQPISAASLPLPSGAATAGNQTNVQGTVSPGTAASNSQLAGCVYNSTLPGPTTGQGLARQCDAKGNARQVIMDAAGNARGANVTASNALTVDGSAVTQPVSAASLPLPSGAATASNQTGGAQKTQIVDGSGNVIGSTTNNLNVQCANCSGSGVSETDEGSFTAGTSVFSSSGGFFQTTATSNALTTGQYGMFQVTANRALFTNLRNASGTEIGTSTTPIQVSVANTGANATAIKVDGSAVTQPVSGAVSITGTPTVNANLNAGTNTVGGVTLPDAQNNNSAGSLNATVTTGTLAGAGTVGISVTGTWVGTLTFQESTDGGTTYTAVNALPLGGGALATTTTSNGQFLVDAAAGSTVQVKMTSYTSGSAAVNFRASVAEGLVALSQPLPTGSNTIGAVTQASGPWSSNLTQIGGVSLGFGSAVSSSSIPVVIASDQVAVAVKQSTAANLNATVVGAAASGSAVTGNPVLMGGSDGTNARNLSTTTAGVLNVAPNSSGATGSAVPANAAYVGANSSGNLTGIIQADSSASISVATATTTKIISNVSSKKTYITHWDLVVAGADNITLEYGTKTTTECDTGTTVLTGAFNFAANGGISSGGGLGPVIVVPASKDVCMVTSAAVQASGSVAYTQF